MTTTKKRVPQFPRLPKGPNGGIQLMLIQNVEHLGKAGDIVEVKAGHANNYLLPEGLAIIANDHHKRMIEKHRAKLQEVEKQRIQSLRSLADQIGKQSINVEANANDEGHLYGSVGANEIVNALKANGFTLSSEQIKLDGVLKELGLYTVKVQLHSDVTTELKVWVVPAAGN
ncbi:MAG: 50S ribosomal protein L9 [Pirellula sp.]|jgi:large subunit ribosomal protein L9|nr:50S ribosomal protein L9 [Pirellula sp.]